MLPETVSVIRIDDRDWDDQYIIASGRTFCFQFIIPENQIVSIGGIHTKVSAQDLSLRCWFSTVPNGQQYFPFQDHMDTFPLVRQIRTILVGSPESGTKYVMPSDKIVYMNVENLQNSENLFRLSFDLLA